MTKVVRLNTNSSLQSERPDLFQAAASGITDVLTIQGLDYRLSSGGMQTAAVIDAFEARAFDHTRGQIDLKEHVLNLANQTDLAGQTADFILTDQDLFAEGTNFVFGVTYADWSLSVQSVARFVKGTSDVGLQRRLVTHVARHEYAHMAGMSQPADYAHPDRRGGIYEGHCADDCTMHQSASVTEAIQQVRRLDGHQVAGFCNSCVSKLIAKRPTS